MIVIWGVVLVLIAYQTSRLVAWDPAVASGGMAHTLAVYRRNVHHSWFRNLVANLAGGTLCLLGGASVGTETPVVQIGASMANGISHQFPPANEMERRDVMAAGAGVGFAVGFSAPVAGLLFTWWFVRSRKNFQFWAYTVFAIGIACFMTRAFYGSGPFFLWPDFCPPEKWVFSWTLALLAVLLGLVSAVFGIVYQG